jgi:drug/metabolite transporter (DMT)-like permease
LSKFELSYAFPFTALSFLFVIFGGVVLLGELLSVARVAGSILILAGILVLALHGREPSP